MSILKENQMKTKIQTVLKQDWGCKKFDTKPIIPEDVLGLYERKQPFNKIKKQNSVQRMALSAFN